MSPPIRDGSGNDIGAIRLGDGSEIAEVRTGAGDVLFSAAPLPDSGLEHRYDVQSQSGAEPLVDQQGSNDLTAKNFSPSINTSGINGNPSITIPLGANFYKGSVASIGSGGEFTVAFVGRWSGSRGFNYGLMNGSGSTYSINFSDAQGNDYAIVTGDGDIRGGTPDTALYIYIMTYDGSTGFFERDGEVLFSGALSTPSSPSGSLSVGGDHNDSTGDELELGELLIYSEFKDSSQRQEIRDYFNRWGF